MRVLLDVSCVICTHVMSAWDYGAVPASVLTGNQGRDETQLWFRMVLLARLGLVWLLWSDVVHAMRGKRNSGVYGGKPPNLRTRCARGCEICVVVLGAGGHRGLLCMA